MKDQRQWKKPLLLVLDLKYERILQGIKELENQTTGNERNINIVSDYSKSNVSTKS
jgi:hypothetical protein